MNTCFASNRPATRSASTLRFSTIVAIAGALAVSLGGTEAKAQTYVGQAYDVGVGLLDLGVGVNVVNLPSAGSATPIAKTVLNVNASLGVLSGIVGANVTSPDITVSTVGSAGYVTSSSLVSGVTIPLIEVLGTGAELTATTVGSTTSATFSSGLANGSTTISNLFLDTTVGGVITSQTALNVSGQANQIINVGVPGVADVILNQQIWDAGHDALTTNAIAVDLVGQTADVTVASSTAGFTGRSLVAAPEPGSMPLIAAGLPFLLGGIGVGRRRLTKRNTSKA